MLIGSRKVAPIILTTCQIWTRGTTGYADPQKQYELTRIINCDKVCHLIGAITTTSDGRRSPTCRSDTGLATPCSRPIKAGAFSSLPFGPCGRLTEHHYAGSAMGKNYLSPARASRPATPRSRASIPPVRRRQRVGSWRRRNFPGLLRVGIMVSIDLAPVGVLFGGCAG